MSFLTQFGTIIVVRLLKFEYLFYSYNNFIHKFTSKLRIKSTKVLYFIANTKSTIIQNKTLIPRLCMVIYHQVRMSYVRLIRHAKILRNKASCVLNKVSNPEIFLLLSISFNVHECESVLIKVQRWLV